MVDLGSSGLVPPLVPCITTYKYPLFFSCIKFTVIQRDQNYFITVTLKRKTQCFISGHNTYYHSRVRLFSVRDVIVFESENCVFYIADRDWEDMKKMPEHQTLVKDFKKIKYGASLRLICA